MRATHEVPLDRLFSATLAAAPERKRNENYDRPTGNRFVDEGDTRPYSVTGIRRLETGHLVVETPEADILVDKKGNRLTTFYYQIRTEVADDELKVVGYRNPNGLGCREDTPSLQLYPGDVGLEELEREVIADNLLDYAAQSRERDTREIEVELGMKIKDRYTKEVVPSRYFDSLP